MIRRVVAFSPEAQADLEALYEHIAEAASEGVAIAYLRRVRTYLAGFDLASERGSSREDMRPGLRLIGFERRITIAFTVDEQEVMIQRVIYGGQDWDSALA